MKKVAILLLIILIFTLSSCVSTQDSVSSTSLADHNSRQKLEARGQYLSLEEIIAASDVLLKGQCVNSIIETDHAEYEFNVLQVYRGRVESQKINVYIPYYSITIHDEDHNIGYDTDDISYVLGESYLLALLDRNNIYLSSNRYVNTGGNLFIPTSNIKSSLMYGDPILKHSNIRSLTSEEDLITYLCEHYDLMADSRSDSNNITYIVDTDLVNVITKSDFVLQIKVADEVYVGSAKDRNTYDCIITDAIRGNIKTGDFARIVFPGGSVKTGDEIIVALFEFENTSPRSFVLSSQFSLFSVNQKIDIVDILNN